MLSMVIVISFNDVIASRMEVVTLEARRERLTNFGRQWYRYVIQFVRPPSTAWCVSITSVRGGSGVVIDGLLSLGAIDLS